MVCRATICLFQCQFQHNGAVVADINPVMHRLHHIISIHRKAGFGNHKIIQPLILFRIAPILIGMGLAGGFCRILGIQEMLRSAQEGLGAFQPIQNRFLKSFLHHVPTACLTAITFPAILFATDHVLSGALGFAIAVLLSLKKKSDCCGCRKLCSCIFSKATHKTHIIEKKSPHICSKTDVR